MMSVDRMRRLGGVSLLALSTLAAVALTVPLHSAANAQDSQSQPRFAAAVPNGAPMSFADLIESVSPAVVTIQAEGSAQNVELAPNTESLPPQFREWLERQFGGQAPQQPMPRQSLGSGFFISAEGHIVTNHHVIRGADAITIGLSDGREFQARLIGSDEQTDLALLQVEADVDFPYVTLDRDHDYRVGDWVVAVGNPFGLGGTATAGIISAIGRPIGNSTYNDFIQVDAPINRGNSGGPTFDLNGNVIGVNSQIFSPTGGNVGIGFAIPSDVAARIIADLMDDGVVARGWLGVSIQNVTADIASALGLEETRGASVSSIVAGGPADRAGFEREDVILEVNGDRVEGSRDLTRRIGDIQAGEDVRFRVIRDGRERTVRATLGNRPSNDELNSMQDTQQREAEVSYFGMRVVPLTDEDRELRNLGADAPGIVVDTLERNGEAARKGLAAGDVILEAGGTPVGSAEAFRSAVENAREDGRSAILLLVETRGGQRYVALQLDEEE